MKIAISQSNYIPWRGYFSMIDQVDTFVLYDEVQFTRNDWRNRNKIKTPNGPIWLTIPTNGNTSMKIQDVRASGNWSRNHLETIKRNYTKAPYFKEVMPLLDSIISGSENEQLTKINAQLLVSISEYLGIQTEFVLSSSISTELNRDCDKTDRLLEINKKLGSKAYLSGPAAKNYFDVEKFTTAGISTEWMNYSHLSEYSQLWGSFISEVSIIDLLFNLGPKAIDHIRMI